MKKYNIDKELTNIKKLEAYTLMSSSFIEELQAMAVVLEHKKNKARVLLMLTDDENKVFTIGFRTPSIDSTGVAHILEHSVLCGSRKFPLKDPFVELVKGSLNTFLNAMTYMDKTLYPIASCNDKDFHNLMDVYLDAVLYPNVYKEEKIFMQEGWHYELENKDDELKINGVVYNEMKGAFSSADSVLERAISKGLFPNHSYGEESGGDPDFIPELSYASFLDFHKRYYHPSNSFIYLYGNIDMAEKLDFIDREYLSNFEYKKLDSEIKGIEVFNERKTLIEEYSITDDESDENSTYLSLHSMVGGELEPIKAAALKILEYLLIDAPGAVLREALQKAGIGEDILGGYEYGIAYPYFSIIAKNTNIDKREEFIKIVKETLKKEVCDGIDRDSLIAAINIAEFRSREADFGHYPKGLIYGLETFNTWLYDADPCMNLRYNQIFRDLRDRATSGYFEELIQELLLDNKFELELILKPVKNLTTIKDNKLKEKLAKIKENLSPKEIEYIIEKTKELKKYQSEGNREEDIASLPVLRREEISTDIDEISYEETDTAVGGEKVPTIYSDINTSGISYMKFSFGADFLTKADLPYLALLREVLGYIDVEDYTYAKLNTMINLHTGGLGFSLESYPSLDNPKDAKFTFSLNVKALRKDIDWAIKLADSSILKPKFENTDRLKEIILEVKAGLKSKILSSGHISSLTRAASYLSKDAVFSEYTKGLEYYKFIEELSINFENKKDELVGKLEYLMDKIFRRSNMLINFIGSKEDFELFKKQIVVFLSWGSAPVEKTEVGFSLENKKLAEAYTSASMVNYVAEFGNYKEKGYEYTGVLRVLKVLLSYDYLWNNIRVMGGAYGAMSSFSRAGNVGLTTYRDPNIGKTYETYDKLVEFIENFEADELAITKLVIGAISELDTLLTPLTKGLRALAVYYSKLSNEILRKERKEVLETTVEDIRKTAPLLKAAFEGASRVCIGNEEKIKENAQYFEKIEALYRD